MSGECGTLGGDRGVDVLKANRLCTLQVQLLESLVNEVSWHFAHDWMMETSRASPHLLSFGEIAVYLTFSKSTPVRMHFL